MYCHNLQNEENNAPNNEDEFRITQSQIDNQKEIERQIKRENEERRQQQNQQYQRNQERRNENQTGNNRNNRNNRNIDINNLNDFFEDFSNLNINNNSNRNNQSRGDGMRQMRIIIGGPNGARVVQQFSSNDRGDINNMDPFNMFFNNNSGIRSQRRTIPFMDFTNQSFGFNLTELIERLRNRDNPTDQEIMNELPETKIEDVNKLDPEKKNCVICLEDFKNGDKATVLPCIHLFHTTCIQNWLKTQNSCPICKFKLTGENINSQHEN
jgi:hypothetical protein